MIRRAVTVAEATVGTDHPLYSMVLNGLANVLCRQV